MKPIQKTNYCNEVLSGYLALLDEFFTPKALDLGSTSSDTAQEPEVNTSEPQPEPEAEATQEAASSKTTETGGTDDRIAALRAKLKR